MPPLILDCHLHPAPLWEPEQWLSSGMNGGIVASVTGGDWQEVLECCAARNDIFIPAIGIHPWHAEALTPEKLAEMQDILLRNPGALIGEIGVDYAPSVTVPHELQEKVFLQQAEISVKLNRPAILHLRGNWDRILELLNNMSKLRGVIHCFSGSGEVAARIVRETALNISIGPSILRENARKVQKAAQNVPLERLFTDSDYPYQSDAPTQCGEICTAVAAVKNMDTAQCARQIAENWRRLIQPGS